MLTITAEDPQPVAVRALFATLDVVGNDPDEARTTTTLLEHLVVLGGDTDDVRDLVEEGALQPWAVNVWPMLSGQHVAAHVEDLPRYPRVSRKHPADVDTEERHAPSTSEIASLSALLVDEQEPERTIVHVEIAEPEPAAVEAIITGPTPVSAAVVVQEQEEAKPAAKPRSPRKPRAPRTSTAK